MKTRKCITEKELKIAAKNIKLQFGIIDLIINEVRKIQRQKGTK